MTDRPTLALVTEAFGGRGGIAQYNRDFLTALAETEGRAPIHVLPRYSEQVGGIPSTVRQHSPRPNRFQFALAAVLIAIRQHPRVIFCGHLNMAPLAAALAKLVSARLIIQLHGIELPSAGRSDLRWALERAHHILCVSRDTRRRVLAYANVAPERVTVICNTVSDRYFPGDRSLSRARWGLGNEFVLLSVGRLDPKERYKGQDLVIPVLPRLLEMGLDVKYLIAGEGGDRERLEALALDCNVGDRVRFVGYVADEDLSSLYGAADLFVLPSTGEGFGIVFLEAMACGTPAVGLGVGGARDALGDGSLGSAPNALTFASALVEVVSRNSPDRIGLSSAVKSRFGQAVFRSAVAGTWARVVGT